MAQLKNFFSTRWGTISVGAFIGVLAPLLQKFGNPGNMGICVACFERDMELLESIVLPWFNTCVPKSSALFWVH